MLDTDADSKARGPVTLSEAKVRPAKRNFEKISRTSMPYSYRYIRVVHMMASHLDRPRARTTTSATVSCLAVRLATIGLAFPTAKVIIGGSRTSVLMSSKVREITPPTSRSHSMYVWVRGGV